MAVFRLRFIAANPERELVQHIAGCRDETNAKEKLRKLFTVVVIKRAELVKE
jgi:hypothetical protein